MSIQNEQEIIVDLATLLTAVVRVEAKLDTLVAMEARVQRLEAHSSWIKGALAALGIIITILLAYENLV